jgi:hypothetical protein
VVVPVRAWNMAHGYERLCLARIGFEEYISISSIGLLYAIRLSDKNKMSTFLFYISRYFFYDEIKPHELFLQ